MTEDQWAIAVHHLIVQGIVQDEAEAIRRLEAGEQLPLKVRIEPGEWRGIVGTTE